MFNDDRKTYIADSARAFADRRIGRRAFLRCLGIAGLGLSSFAATMLGSDRPRWSGLSREALANTGPSPGLTKWLRDVGGRYKGTKIRYISEPTPPTLVARLLARDEFTAATGIDVEIEVAPLEEVLRKAAVDVRDRVGAYDLYYLDQSWTPQFIGDTIDPRDTYDRKRDLALPDFDWNDFGIAREPARRDPLGDVAVLRGPACRRRQNSASGWREQEGVGGVIDGALLATFLSGECGHNQDAPRQEEGQMARLEVDGLPIIDVGSLWRGATDAEISRLGEQVHGACRSTGFFYIANHGVPRDLIAAAFDANRRFHALPIADKLRIKLNRWHRGYQAVGGSTLVSSARFAPARHPNQLESFFIRHEVDPADPDYQVRPLQGPNQWPDDTGFRDIVGRYDAAMCDAGMRLLKVFSTAIGEKADFFGQRFSPPATCLRLIHYPPAPIDRPDDLYGAHPHTDYGFLTILAQDDVGGLEVRRPDGTWQPVPFVPDTFVVNIGDILARWTNDVFNSTPHRVINASSGGDRYSIGYFFDPGLDTEISTLKGFEEGAGPSKYTPIRYADYFNGRLDANYADRTGL